MCILSYIPRDVALDASVEIDLFNGGISNPDGHGWAVASDNGLIIMGKSLDLDDALEGLMKARTAHSGPAMFHSRWATHGSITVGNCHPFNMGGMSGNYKTVVAHNGVLPVSAWPAKGDDRPDSAVLAEDMMPQRWRRLGRATVRQSLEQYIGKSNKLVILTVDPRYRDNAYIINEGAGIWDSPTGVWHSNSDYRYTWSSKLAVAVTAGTSYPAQLDNDVDPTECVYCCQRVNAYGTCTTCGTCQDCLEASDDCLCYRGSAFSADSFDPDMPIPFDVIGE